MRYIWQTYVHVRFRSLWTLHPKRLITNMITHRRPTLHVNLPNGHILESIRTVQLKLPHIPPSGNRVNIINIPSTYIILSIPVLTRLGCITIFTTTLAFIFYKGKHNLTERYNKLANFFTTIIKQQNKHYNTFHNLTTHTPQHINIPQITKYLHKDLGSPNKHTLIAAIKKLSTNIHSPDSIQSSEIHGITWGGYSHGA